MREVTRVRHKTPALVGAVVAALHAGVVIYIFSVPMVGSWQGFYAFWLDFPLSICWVKVGPAGYRLWFHLFLGSAWWFAIAWVVSKLLVMFVARLTRQG